LHVAAPIVITPVAHTATILASPTAPIAAAIAPYRLAPKTSPPSA
jgi:hypothetical protein